MTNIEAQKKAQDLIPIEDAVSIVLSESKPLPTMTVRVYGAGGYVIAETVHADLDTPAFDRVMMDGYALSASDSGEGVELPVTTTLAAGNSLESAVPKGHAVKIMTGAPLPEGCDAVIMVELTSAPEEGRVKLEKKVEPGENISFQGEEVKAGQEILKIGTLITPPVAAVLAMAGKPWVKVFSRPRVAILVTGTELVDPLKIPGPGKIRESNSYGLFAQTLGWGGLPIHVGQAGDDPTDLRAAIEKGLQFEILAITGGVSMGDYDLVPDILAEAGVEILFHNVSQKPAKPMLFGKRGSTLVFGLPGNPVACFLGFELYAGPAIRHLCGESDFETKWFQGKSKGEFKVRSDRDHLKVARAENIDGEWVVQPIASMGSADIYSVVGSNAFVRFEKGLYTVPSGEKVTFFMHRGKSHGTY